MLYTTVRYVRSILLKLECCYSRFEGLALGLSRLISLIETYTIREISTQTPDPPELW